MKVQPRSLEKSSTKSGLLSPFQVVVKVQVSLSADSSSGRASSKARTRQAKLVSAIRGRVVRYLRRLGKWPEVGEGEAADGDTDLLLELGAAAVQGRTALGERAGARDVRVVGTTKFDSASSSAPSGVDELTRVMGIVRGHSTIVAGSTGPGEEAVLLDFYARQLARDPTLQLIIVPRKPERFDEVATLIQSRGFACARRSRPDSIVSNSQRILLGDTMGELRKFYALADVVFVGRTLVDLGPKQHGSDMIEPAALGKAVIVGSFTGNFLEPMNAFRKAKAIVEVRDAGELGSAIDRLLRDRDEREQLGSAAQQVVEAQRGSTDRHLEVILPMMKSENTRETPMPPKTNDSPDQSTIA